MFYRALANLGITCDQEIILQKTTATFLPGSWDTALAEVTRIKPVKSYIYIILKTDEDTINLIYVGKSTQKDMGRIQDHQAGLAKVFSGEPSNGNGLYYRMKRWFFGKNEKLPLRLLIFYWNESRMLNTLFSFPFDLNVSNAESLLISYFSSANVAVLNHEFIGRFNWKTHDINFNSIKVKPDVAIKGSNALDLWNSWCNDWYCGSDLSPCRNNSIRHEKIPLFETNDGLEVITTTITQKNSEKLKIFNISNAMRQRVIEAVKFTEEAYECYVEEKGTKKLGEKPLFCDGLVYMVYHTLTDFLKMKEYHSDLPNTEIMPIYIGKTEMLGRNGTYSGNLKGITSGHNRNYFARWGTDRARHIGGLSARFYNLPNPFQSTDYEQWIARMFSAADRAKGKPILKAPVYFQMKPWFPCNISFSGRTRLLTPEIESCLIALVRYLFGDLCANKHGR